MAKSLNLKIQRLEDDSIFVSWDDVVLPEFSRSSGTKYGLGATGWLIFCMVLGFSSGNMLWFLAGIIGVIVFVIIFKKSRTEPNSMSFDQEVVTHRGRRFPTPEITRFEYGLRSQLTGSRPQKDGHGNEVADPMLIRMWINDSAAHEVSLNNWQNQVCHEIRDALDTALQQVRKDAREQEQVKTFGKQGDFGVPDY